MTTYATTDADLAAFRGDGFFIVPDLFTDAECDAALEHIEQAAFELALGEADDGPLSYRPMMHLASPELTAVATDPRWGPVVLPLLEHGRRAALLGAGRRQAAARANGAAVAPGQRVHAAHPRGVRDVLARARRRRRGERLPRRHPRKPPRTGRIATSTVARDRSGSGTRARLPTGSRCPCRRGSVLVFSSLLLHRSGPNVTDRPRRAWIIQFCSAAARSALSGKLLDDRLLLADGGAWLPEPVRQREFDLVSVLANYDQR